MAVGRLSVVVGVKGKAGPHAQYIAREGKYAKHNDGLEKLEGTGHGNMPEWAQADPNFFWKMSDDKERKNGTSYREHIITLPRELTADQRHELIKEWIQQEIGEKHAYQYAIHNPLAMDGLEQPHAHLMFSERLIDGIDRDPDNYFKRYNTKNPERGGGKKANTPKLADERKLELKDQRDRWEKLCNSHLELAGSDARISMKSLEEQGIDREPINLSMQQIKTPSIKSVYEHQLKLSVDLKQVEKDSQAINAGDELIRVYKEVEQNADRASERAREAIDTGRKVSDEASEALNGSGERVDARKYAFTPLYSGKGIKNRDYDPVIEPSPWTDNGVEKAHIGLRRSKQLLDAINRELERDEIELKRKIRSKIAKEQPAKKPALDKVAIEQVEVTEKEAKAVADKTLERQRIEKRKPSAMINRPSLRIQIGETDQYGHMILLLRDVISHVSGEVHTLIKNAIKGNHQIIITNTSKQGKQLNPEYAQNSTARAFEKFMLDENVLSDARILIDFGLGKASEALGIREFAEKYDIKCDFHDLEKLDSLNPVVNTEPKIEKPAQQSSESKPQNDSSYDNSLNYP